MSFCFGQINCCCGCTDGICFCVDVTGSMGGHDSKIESLCNQLIDDFAVCFAVATYDDAPGSDPAITQKFTSKDSDAHAAVNALTSGGGADTDEDNFTALYGLGINWLDADILGGGTGKKIIVWCGDAKSHTDFTSQADAISALQAKSIRVVGLNFAASGSGIDGDGQASAIVAACGGHLFNDADSLAYADLKTQIENLLS